VLRARTLCQFYSHLRKTSYYLSISDKRVELARKYFLLDCVARFGGILADEALPGSVTIPGYSLLYGLPLVALGSKISNINPTVTSLWKEPSLVLGDIGWLAEKGYIKNH
jgi:hypothetical protein